MKFCLKKLILFFLSLGIIFNILYFSNWNTNNNHTTKDFYNLPKSSTWIQNGVKVTSGVPLITYEDMAMCSDGAGGMIIAWSDERYVSFHVYAQRIDSNGNVKWTSNGVPMWDPWFDDQTGVQICSDGAGGAIIVWQDPRNDYSDLYAQRVDSNGNKLWYSRGEPIAEANRYQTDVKICSDGAGGAFIVWDDDRVSDNDIYVQRINSAGVVQWTANGVNICNAAGYQVNPEICSDGAGGIIIAWDDARAGSNLWDIYAQRVNSAGVVQWTTNGIPICTAQYWQRMDDIHSDGLGGAIIAWGDRRNHQYEFDIYAQRVNSNGNTLWTMGGVPITTSGGNQYDARIINSGTGGAIISWHDGNIYAQRVSPTGSIQWATNGLAICNAIGGQSYSEICSDGSDGAIITWEDGRAGNSDIYAQRIGSNGIPQWTLNGTPVCSLANYQGIPQILGNGAGHAFIAWQDKRTYNGRDIYATYLINSIPTSTHPSDINTAFERSASIGWTLSDDTGTGQYRVVANDTYGDYYEVQGWTSWTDGTFINISIDTSITGFFEFILEFYDSDNQFGANDTVLVHVIENTAPTSNHPEDVVVIKYRTKTIDWTLDDEWDGGKYKVMANDSVGDFYVYKNWTSWALVLPITILIDSSLPGNYNYTIIYYDNQEKYGIQDTVVVSVLDDLNPTSDHPSDIVTVHGDNQYIRWTLNDDYGGGSYRVIANNSLGNFYVYKSWSSWYSGERTSVGINRTITGSYNYTIEYYDNYGQYGVPDTVLVTVNQNNPPTCNHPEDITTSKDGTETIQWILSDDYGGGSYRVIIMISGGSSSTWIDWTDWEIDIPFEVAIDRSSTGVFNYTIEYRDIYGMYGEVDTVQVTVLGGDNGPSVPGYNLFVLLGVISIIIVLKVYKKNYK